ncbi:hypothetical protein BK131_02320 [Paenibacillus amylolyticus]|uniref:DUF4064 domain-containing protein n=1 Tax=Paenibacillus amylolyticus TaxID=1451 RepID=A0A1R1C492_PAEAM|nr:hypothetical protein [Paenibacillus amylolyticus]OMF16849.1 hypothetical protein BK131_02320 [Paenibacillus amylolyticus]
MDNHNSYNSGYNNTDQYNNNMVEPYPPDHERQPMAPLKHSGPGIASFVIGLVAVVGYILIFFIAAMALNDSIEVLTPLQAEELALHPAVILASLSILVCLILNLAGGILGIIGLILKNRKKVFAIIGTLLNGIIILAFIGLILAGMSMM